jgi:hypothetical protein
MRISSYKGYGIFHNPKPIPPSVVGDFDFVHDDIDGAPDSPYDPRQGHGKTVMDCMKQIDEIEAEENEQEE